MPRDCASGTEGLGEVFFEGVAGDAEGVGGLGVVFAVFLEDAGDVPALEGFEVFGDERVGVGRGDGRGDGDGSLGEDGPAIEGVVEFSDVSWPGVVEEGVEGFALGALGGIAVEVVSNERREVFEALAEGRGVEGEDAEAIPEVCAEFALADELFNVAMGGGNDADVNVLFAGIADSSEFFLLEEAEEEALGGEGEVANLIEEEGAAIGLLNDAGGVVIGTCEGAFGIAEKAGFEEGFANDVAIEGNEGLSGAFLGVAMEEDGNGFFAGAAFAEDDDVVIGGADFLDVVFEGADGGAGAGELAMAPGLELGEAEGVVFPKGGTGLEKGRVVFKECFGGLGEDFEELQEEVVIGVVVSEGAGAFFGHLAEFIDFFGEGRDGEASGEIEGSGDVWGEGEGIVRIGIAGDGVDEGAEGAPGVALHFPGGVEPEELGASVVEAPEGFDGGGGDVGFREGNAEEEDAFPKAGAEAFPEVSAGEVVGGAEADVDGDVDVVDGLGDAEGEGIVSGVGKADKEEEGIFFHGRALSFLSTTYHSTKMRKYMCSF